MTAKSQIEIMIRSRFPDVIAEHRFHPTRRWDRKRFDRSDASGYECRVRPGAFIARSWHPMKEGLCQTTIVF